MRRNDWKATPVQSRFLLADDDEVLYGGAAGGGKTDALLALAAMRCQTSPFAHVLYVRRAYPDLEMSAIRRSHEMLTGVASYKGDSHRWVWRNGSVLQFGYVESDDDVFRYQSAEFDLVIVDELTQLSEFQWTYLLSRNRTSRKGAAPIARAATNPGGAGHEWVRRRFVDVAPPGEQYRDPETGRTRRFVPARVQDNPYLLGADPGYIARLRELPRAQRAALLDGSWDVLEGSYFDEWRHEVHTCEPFAVPTEWRRFRALDWGFARPFAVGWFAVDFDGRLWMYREWYGCAPDQPNVGLRMNVADVAAGIIRRETLTLQDGRTVREPVAEGIADPAIWARTGHKGGSVGEQFADAGLSWGKADNDRVHGWMQLHERLRPVGDEPPMLVVFRSCRGLIRTLPALRHDQHRPEDLDSAMEDHAADMLRYAVMSRPMSPVRAVKPLTFIQEHKRRIMGARKGRRRLL